MPFLDHLEELRMRILWSLVAVTIGAVGGFILIRYFRVLHLLLHPIRVAMPDNPDFQLIYLSPADPFFITLKLSVVVGIILAFPIIVYHIWSFLSPALESHEKRAIIPALYLGLVLFCAGVALAYFVALPVSIAFFQTFEGGLMQAQYEIGETLNLITKILIGFGIIFELPVVVMILSALGLVTPEFLKSKRRHAIVAITVAASVLTPGDVVTLTVMLMVPLFFLYEFSIYLSILIWRGKRARERAEKEAEEKGPGGPPQGDPPTGGSPGAGPGGGGKTPDGGGDDAAAVEGSEPDSNTVGTREESGGGPDSVTGRPSQELAESPDMEEDLREAAADPPAEAENHEPTIMPPPVPPPSSPPDVPEDGQTPRQEPGSPEVTEIPVDSQDSPEDSEGSEGSDPEKGS
jgi:sec-independent protein translocase protein TatC